MLFLASLLQLKFSYVRCPPFSSKSDMLVNIHSTLQMPSNTPVLTVVDPGNCALAVKRYLVYNQLGALSPLDGRYANSVKDLNVFFSGCISDTEYMLKLNISSLSALKKIKEFPALAKNQIDGLRKVYREFDMDSAKKVKEIEAETNHDVKAIEYYLQQKTDKSLHPWIHFALTSEDVNNLSYSLHVQHGLNRLYPIT